MKYPSKRIIENYDKQNISCKMIGEDPLTVISI
jgi:hypothetical protein